MIMKQVDTTFADRSGVNQQRIVIMNSQGRTGTTMLQEDLCRDSVTNLGERIDMTDAISYRNSIDELTNRKNSWCSKIFLEKMNNDGKEAPWYTPHADIYILNPTKLINSYREDTFDQFLSLQISINNNKWNSTEKLQYTEFTMSSVEEKIKLFKRNIQEYDKTVEQLSRDFDVINTSYESLLTDTTNTSWAKQNTKEEKMKLIINIDEVIKCWNTYD